MQCDACIRKELHAECSAPAQVLEYSAPESVAYAVLIAAATGGFGSLPVEPTVYSCTCGDIHCAGTSIARCTLPLVEYMRRHHQCPCTCACHGVHRAGISSVYAGPVQVLEYFAPAPVAYYALWFQFSPCRAHRLHLHLWWSTLRRHHNGMLHRACLNVHRANWDGRAQFFDSVVIFPMSR